jgi:hypothetical protein
MPTVSSHGIKAPSAGANGASALRYGSVERHRNNPEERGQQQWFGGEPQYPDPSDYARYETPADAGAYRSPDIRGGARAPAGPPPERAGRGPWTPEHSVPVQPEMVPRDPMHHRDMTATGELWATGRIAGSVPHPDKSRGRPVAGAVIWLVTVALALPVLRILLDSLIGPPLSASGVVSSVLLLLGLPIGAIGLHGLASGAARVTGAPAYTAWLRPPVAYLPIALLLCIAAGLAAR